MSFDLNGLRRSYLGKPQSFWFFLCIGNEPQTFACVGLSGRSAKIKTRPVNLLGSIRGLWLVGLG